MQIQEQKSTIKDIEKLKQCINDLKAKYPNGLPYEPKQSCTILDTDLDFKDLVEPDATERELIQNSFACFFCKKVPQDPYECKNDDCLIVCCKKCIDNWNMQSKSCPKKCKGDEEVEFKELHRYQNIKLESLKFKCEIEECTFVGTYKYALQHKLTCPHRHKYKQCAEGCGLYLWESDMEYHKYVQCKLFKIECECCEMDIHPNDPENCEGLDEDWLVTGSHDCVRGLK